MFYPNEFPYLYKFYAPKLSALFHAWVLGLIISNLNMVNRNSLIVLVLIVAFIAFVQAKPSKTKQGSESSAKGKDTANVRKPPVEQEEKDNNPSKSKQGQDSSSGKKGAKDAQTTTTTPNPKQGDDLSEEDMAVLLLLETLVDAMVSDKTKGLQQDIDAIRKG